MEKVLFKHKKNTDVAVEILKWNRPVGKPYTKIKVTWWNIGPHEPFWLGQMTTGYLTDATKIGKERKKYPLDLWHDNWELYKWAK